MLTAVPALFRFFHTFFGVVPSAPTIYYRHFILEFTFQSLLSYRARFWYLSTLSPSFSTLVSPGTAISTKSAVLLSFSTATMSGRLCSITWCIWILTSQRIFTFSVSMYRLEDDRRALNRVRTQSRLPIYFWSWRGVVHSAPIGYASRGAGRQS